MYFQQCKSQSFAKTAKSFSSSRRATFLCFRPAAIVCNNEYCREIGVIMSTAVKFLQYFQQPKSRSLATSAESFSWRRRSSFLCFRPVVIVCNNEYCSVIVLWLTTLSKAARSGSSVEDQATNSCFISWSCLRRSLYRRFVSF